jgi:hypothetical protein
MLKHYMKLCSNVLKNFFTQKYKIEKGTQTLKAKHK